MRRLPDMMAQAAGGAAERDRTAAQRVLAAAAARRAQSAAGRQHGRQRSMGRAGAGQGGGDPQQMLSRAPAIQLVDLKKGEAVMLVSTDGSNRRYRHHAAGRR